MHVVTETPLVLTEARLAMLLEETGTRPPFDHACLTNDQWAEIRRMLLDVARYMRQAEAWFDDIERQAAGPPPDTGKPGRGTPDNGNPDRGNPDNRNSGNAGSKDK